jgi:hypothetical protein
LRGLRRFIAVALQQTPEPLFASNLAQCHDLILDPAAFDRRATSLFGSIQRLIVE